MFSGLAFSGAWEKAWNEHISKLKGAFQPMLQDALQLTTRSYSLAVFKQASFNNRYMYRTRGRADRGRGAWQIGTTDQQGGSAVLV